MGGRLLSCIELKVRAINCWLACRLVERSFLHKDSRLLAVFDRPATFHYLSCEVMERYRVNITVSPCMHDFLNTVEKQCLPHLTTGLLFRLKVFLGWNITIQ